MPVTSFFILFGINWPQISLGIPQSCRASLGLVQVLENHCQRSEGHLAREKPRALIPIDFLGGE